MGRLTMWHTVAVFVASLAVAVGIGLGVVLVAAVGAAAGTLTRRSGRSLDPWRQP